MYDIKCPYCNEEEEINHDDGYGYEEGKLFEQECGSCEMVFLYSTHISFDHDAYKAPCKNGKPHKWEPCCGYPKGYMENRHRCSYCDEVEIIDKSLNYNVVEDCWKPKLEQPINVTSE